MKRRPNNTKAMNTLRTQKVGTMCPVVGCETLLTPSARAKYSRSAAESAATVEHVIPLSEGGAHTLSNVVIICHSCNDARNQLLTNNRAFPGVCRFYWSVSLSQTLEPLLLQFYSELHREFLAYKASAKVG